MDSMDYAVSFTGHRHMSSAQDQFCCLGRDSPVLCLHEVRRDPWCCILAKPSYECTYGLRALHTASLIPADALHGCGWGPQGQTSWLAEEHL